VLLRKSGKTKKNTLHMFS